MEKITRGLRNNNPFNIRKSKNKWLGKIKGTDKEFETFDTLAHGYRAGLLLFCTYYRKYKLHSYGEILERFAPSSENNTENYKKWIQQYTDIYPDSYISLRVFLLEVAPLIAYYESNFFDDNIIEPVEDNILKLYNLNKEYE